MAITIAYDRSVKGWTSEFSFIPDAGISLNNNYYTFVNGEIWRHNSVDTDRNSFYGSSNRQIFHPTTIKFIFNQEPSAAKNFKTVNIEGEGSWTGKITTNLEEGTVDFTDVTKFKDIEGKLYANINGEYNQLADLDLKSASVGGIGIVSQSSAFEGNGTVTFDQMPSSVSIGDAFYISKLGNNDVGGEPLIAGFIESIDGNTITLTPFIDSISDGAVSTFYTPVEGDLGLYIKNNAIEKSGLVGFFAEVELTTYDTNFVELFAASTEVFKSS